MNIKNINYYDEIDNILNEYYAEDYDKEYVLCENEEYEIPVEGCEDVIAIYGPIWRVVDKGLIFVEGTYCNYDTETETWMPDWSLTLIYKDVPDDQFDINKYDYFEQDPPATAIHNYLMATEKPVEVKETKIA